MRYLDNPNVWIDRAEQMRTNAESMTSAEGHRTCLTIAEQYYRMAEMAQQRLDFAERRRQAAAAR